METVFPNCAGIDVHKSFLMVCRLHHDDRGRLHRETRSFGTMTHDLRSLRTWLLEGGCTHLVMESTGVYWLPIYNLLEDHFQVWIVNAQHIKRVPGRKTDVKDAEWLAQLLQHGLVQPSFIPPRAQRELRDLVRYRQTLIEERTRISNRMEKVLEDANIKLAAVVSRLQGVSAQAILRAVIAGETTPEQLAALAQGRLRRKLEALTQALDGDLRDHHRFLLMRLLGHLDYLNAELTIVEAAIEAKVDHLPGYRAALTRLDTIPGISSHIALLLVAEIGIDMSRFPSAKQLSAWAGLAPGNNETGGKARPSRTRKGNIHLQRGLVQAAQAVSHTRTYLGAQFSRLAARRGVKRASVAVAHTILQIAYYLLKRQETYQELGSDYFEQRNREHVARRLLGRLASLGYDVGQVTPPEPKAPELAA